MSRPVLKQVSILHVTLEDKNSLKWKVACQHEYLNFWHTYLDGYFMKLVNYFSCFCCISELINFVNSANTQKVQSVHLGHKLSLWGKTPVMWENIWARNPGQVIHQGQETHTCWNTGQSPLFLFKKILCTTHAKYQVKTNKTNEYHKKSIEIFRECEKIRDVPAWLLSYFFFDIVRAFLSFWYE